MNTIPVGAAVTTMAIVALAVRQVWIARREGRPWRGTVIIWASGVLLAAIMMFVTPVNGGLSWALCIASLFGMAQGAALARREGE